MTPMNWTCEQIEARLSDYIDGLLDSDERKAFETHAKDCAECWPLVESVQVLVGAMHATEALEAPPRLVYAILDKTLGPRDAVTGWQAVLKFLRGLGTPRFAYGAASVMATLVLLLSATGFSFRKPKLADFPEAIVPFQDAD